MLEIKIKYAWSEFNIPVEGRLMMTIQQQVLINVPLSPPGVLLLIHIRQQVVNYRGSNFLDIQQLDTILLLRHHILNVHKVKLLLIIYAW